MNQGWKCYHCKRMNKRLAEFCQSCGTHCEQAIDNWQWAGADGGTPRQRGEWSWQPWEDWEDIPRTSRSSSRARNASAKKRSKGKGKGKDRSKDKTEQPLVSPFTVMPTAQEAVHSTPFPPPSTVPSTMPEVSSSSTELMMAIRRAFPDSQSMPSELRDAMEKSESVATKMLTQELHRATTSMGKAQKAYKELQDAKERHRMQWLQHMETSLKAWKQQMEGYDKKQQDFVEAIQKAKKDMDASHVLIQNLNAKAAGKPPPPPQAETIELDGPEDLSHIADKEERKLRRSLQHILAECATKSGTKPVMDEFIIASDDEKQDKENTTKRQRSDTPGALEPGAAGTSLVPQAT